MAGKSEEKWSPAVQAAMVRDLLARNPKLTLEGIETEHPELAEGVKLVLAQQPKAARSGAAPVTRTLAADIL